MSASARLAQSRIDASTEVFGAHPASVFAIVKNAAIAAENIDAIFSAFSTEFDRSGVCRRDFIRLAYIGRELSKNISHYLSASCAELSAALLVAGVDVNDAKEIVSTSPKSNVQQATKAAAVDAEKRTKPNAGRK